MPSITFYNKFKKLLGDKEIDLVDDTIKLMLVTSAYVPDYDTHDYKDDITNEISGTGYSAGGATLANKTMTQDNTDNEGVWDADDVTWTNASFTCRGGVLYKDTGVAGTSPVIGYINFDTDRSPSTEDFTVQWNAEGILNLT